MWFRVTQKRSVIGLPKRLRETALALGLKKRGRITYHPVNRENAGQILTLKELVEVQIVDKPLERHQETLLKRRPSGYTVEKPANSQ